MVIVAMAEIVYSTSCESYQKKSQKAARSTFQYVRPHNILCSTLQQLNPGRRSQSNPAFCEYRKRNSPIGPRNFWRITPHRFSTSWSHTPSHRVSPHPLPQPVILTMSSSSSRPQPSPLLVHCIVAPRNTDDRCGQLTSIERDH